MKLPFTITDYYGDEVTVEPLMGSVGPVVDINLPDDSFLRFQPEEAVKLGEAIIAAAEARL